MDSEPDLRSTIVPIDIPSDERSARAKLEAVRWPNGPICPHCEVKGRVYELGHIRHGLKKCARCRKQFTVRTGTILESSHIPLLKWVQAIYLIGVAEGGNSPPNLRRALALDLAAASAVLSKVRAALRQAHWQRTEEPHTRSQQPSHNRESEFGFDQIILKILAVRPRAPQHTRWSAPLGADRSPVRN